jgi:hypothetical protein
MPAGSLHSSLSLINLQNYQGMQRKEEKGKENKGKCIKYGFYERFVFKQYNFGFQMLTNAFIYVLKHLSR